MFSKLTASVLSINPSFSSQPDPLSYSLFMGRTPGPLPAYALPYFCSNSLAIRTTSSSLSSNGSEKPLTFWVIFFRRFCTCEKKRYYRNVYFRKESAAEDSNILLFFGKEFPENFISILSLESVKNHKNICTYFSPQLTTYSKNYHFRTAIKIVKKNIFNFLQKCYLIYLLSNYWFKYLSLLLNLIFSHLFLICFINNYLIY